MKKLICAAYCILLCAVFCACSSASYKKSDLKKVESEVENEALSASLVGTSAIMITNISDEEVTFGEYFSLQVKIDDEWYYVPLVSDMDTHDLAHTLMPDKSQLLTCDLTVYGTLKPGEYRIACAGGYNGDDIWAYSEALMADEKGDLYVRVKDIPSDESAQTDNNLVSRISPDALGKAFIEAVANKNYETIWNLMPEGIQNYAIGTYVNNVDEALQYIKYSLTVSSKRIAELDLPSCAETFTYQVGTGEIHDDKEEIIGSNEYLFEKGIDLIIECWCEIKITVTVDGEDTELTLFALESEGQWYLASVNGNDTIFEGILYELEDHYIKEN